MHTHAEGCEGQELGCRSTAASMVSLLPQRCCLQCRRSPAAARLPEGGARSPTTETAHPPASWARSAGRKRPELADKGTRQGDLGSEECHVLRRDSEVRAQREPSQAVWAPGAVTPLGSGVGRVGGARRWTRHLLGRLESPRRADGLVGCRQPLPAGMPPRLSSQQLGGRWCPSLRREGWREDVVW